MASSISSVRLVMMIVGGSLLFLLAANWLLGLGESDDHYPIRRVVAYSFEITNSGNRVVEHGDFWAYAPVKQTSSQRLVSLNVSEPYEIVEDKAGNQIIHIALNDVPPYGTRIVNVQAELAMSDEPNEIDLENREDYLQAEKYIESDAPALREQAEQMQHLAVMDTARALFDWVRGHVQDIGYVQEQRGALYALQQKKGDCTEFAGLYTALARASEIPARMMGGYVYSNNAVINGSDYHNWAEFYHDESWHVADAQKDIWLANPSHFIAMHVVAPVSDGPMEGYSRFRVAGENLLVMMR